MCGRYALFATTSDIQHHFQPAEPLVLQPRYNIAPEQRIPVVALGTRRIIFMHWGLKPNWMRFEEENGFIYKSWNDIQQKPGFKRLFDKQRCLIPATGFYLWKEIRNGKQPFYFSLPQGLFAIGGIWDKPKDQKDMFSSSCSFIVHTGIEQATFHFPLIIAPEFYSTWLKPNKIKDDVMQTILQKAQSLQLRGHPVSTIVNDPTTDEAGCILSLV